MNFDRSYSVSLPYRRQSVLAQWAVLTSIAVMAVAPRFWKSGTNVVTETYRKAVDLFLAGQIPYGFSIPGGDRYEYSPLFCLIYAPFAALPPSLQAIVWTAFNAGFFWAGVLCWCNLKRPIAWYTIVGFVFCAMELNISLLYQQTNAFLIGLSLIALALFREKHFFLAAILLTIATNLKPIPGIFALPLLFFIDRNFWRGLVVASIVCLLTPALVVGLSHNVDLHIAWLKALTQTLSKSGSPQIDIGSFLEHRGVAVPVGETLRYLVLVLGLGTLISNIWTWRFQWPHWITLAATTILLSSPRSESPTFVFLAACFPLLVVRDSENRIRFSHIAILLVTGVLITAVYTDVWPKSFLPFLKEAYFSKTLGTLLLWLYALGVSLSDLVKFPAGAALYVEHRESHSG